MYWYGLNNPTNNIDPNGLWVVGGGVGGAAGAGIGDPGVFGSATSGFLFGSSKCGGIGAGGFTATATGTTGGAFAGLSASGFFGFGDIEDIKGGFEVFGFAFLDLE